MNVLMITGDRRLVAEAGNAAERLALQKSAVERLDVVYWGRGALTDVFRVKGAYDVVTVQDPLWRGLIGLFVARRLRAKLNVQVHMDLDALSFTRHILAQIVLRHADSIRVVSKRLKARVERIGVRAKITVLPVFIDLEKFTQIERKPHEGKTILWLGRFEKEKNPFAALEIVREVLETVADVHLVMLGAGSLGSKLSAYTADLPVTFPGWQDPLRFLETADMVLSTSLHESWGASIIEALAAGIPVVAPDVGVAREAGAVVVPRKELARAAIETLTKGEKGELHLQVLSKEAWARAWRDSLI